MNTYQEYMVNNYVCQHFVGRGMFKRDSADTGASTQELKEASVSGGQVVVMTYLN